MGIAVQQVEPAVLLHLPASDLGKYQKIAQMFGLLLSKQETMIEL